MPIRTVLSAHSPRFADPQNSTIMLKVLFEELQHYGELDFLATPDDIEPHGREIYQAALAGQYGELLPYQPPA